MLLMILTLCSLCSCARNTTVQVVSGIDEYVVIPKGTTFSVPMNLDGEIKNYTMVTQVDGAYYSIDAQASILKARAKDK